jgi:hypothetical protein
MDPRDVERRGKCRRHVVPVADMRFAAVNNQRSRRGSDIHDIIAVSKNDRIERSLQGHVIVAVSQNDGRQAVASVNRDSGGGGRVANDDIAYPAEIQNRANGTDIVDNAESRSRTECYIKIKIMMPTIVLIIIVAMAISASTG